MRPYRHAPPYHGYARDAFQAEDADLLSLVATLSLEDVGHARRIHTDGEIALQLHAEEAAALGTRVNDLRLARSLSETDWRATRNDFEWRERRERPRHYRRSDTPRFPAGHRSSYEQRPYYRSATYSFETTSSPWQKLKRWFERKPWKR